MEDSNFSCGTSLERLLTNCLGLGSSASRQSNCGVLSNAQFGLKSRLALYTSPSTVGGSALALHYTNVIIVIDKLLRYPYLVGEEARDDLYQMLPTSLRLSLRTNLKSYVKNLAIKSPNSRKLQQGTTRTL
ncbi:hypothetical protein J1N35_008294 [Gossypium stocksii]|uniref:DUF668 domain-containing protein n=1 Tax=Gossypium stocksii TaxID=47602 RepID=A0A9D4AGJ5_9ROSI|nr:hypothetical protein J1N35_008294 [Gossypium stocksii]